MESIKQFSVTESFDYQSMLDEAIETILSANAELGPAQRQPDRELQETVEPLRKLKGAQAVFARNLTVRPLNQEDFAARGLQPSAEVSQWLQTHRFYLVQVPVTLMPVAGWAFTRLECWVGFEGSGAEPKVHDLYPEDVWTRLLSLQGQLQLGLDETLKFHAGLEYSQTVYQALSEEVQVKVTAEVTGGIRMVIGPFNYSVSRPTVLGRGRENSEVFWRLDGHEHVQREEPYLAVVLRVPQAVNGVNAKGELRAYHQFDFLGANLSDWTGSFRKKLRSFFSNGIPLEAKTRWDHITT